ncbi:MAG: SCO family protein [Cellulophaga sp.]|nr:SCO family protein [Cellulophaga sp.]
MKLTRLLFISISVLFFFSCKEIKKIDPKLNVDEITALPYFNSPDFTPEWKSGTHKIPDFTFLNQNGDTITNKNYEEKIYIADFFFTSCPGICPSLTKNMSTLQNVYLDDADVLLLSHSVMPDYDTVAVLKEYAEKHKVNDIKWNLITGNKDAIYKIARSGYFADEDFTLASDDGDFIHTENFILVDKKGFIRGVYNGTIELEVKRLIRHVEILKKEEL